MNGEAASGAGLEFLGRLAGGLVHEIKNPLSTLRINLTLLREDLEAGGGTERRLVRRIELMEDEVRRLDAVLNDFLRYAGMRRLERERTDLGALAAGMGEFLGPGFRGDGIEFTCDAGALPADVDAALFKQALLNILLNAQQALGAGGGRIHLTGGVEGGETWLEVRDDGPGIEPGDLERVFEVYYSGSKAGSGLGLPTARRILEQHGGRLELESEPGRGTRVRLVVPGGGA